MSNSNQNSSPAETATSSTAAEKASLKIRPLPPPQSVESILIPNQVPRMGKPWMRKFGCWWLRMMGWRVAGILPNEPRLVIAGAPHTSNWDFVLAIALVLALGLRFSYLMKKEAFFWPFKGLFMKLGGIPVDRSEGGQIMEQIKQWMNEHEQCWVAMTPEGTRTQVDRYKTGFLRIAYEVRVPILLVSWNYPNKTFYIVPPPPLSGDLDLDADRVKRFLEESFTGKNN